MNVWKTQEYLGILLKHSFAIVQISKNTTVDIFKSIFNL